jgi:hypothetical protein
MANYYLNSYVPLVASPEGREASAKFRILPFVDGSIRREPDLEHERPSISCLCRGPMFAPRLRVGDVVGYRTNKGTYDDSRDPERRFIAVLKVLHLLPTHEGAADWYTREGFPLPSNCMVPGNPPQPLDRSHRLFNASDCAGDARTLEEWDASYQKRANDNPTFVVCLKLWSNLGWSAPVVTNDDLIAAFDRIPGAENPGKLPRAGFETLLKRLGIDVVLS